MPPTPVPGFITKKETAQHFQRSHRQITRDLADAMKVQNPKVLDNCRLHTEDGETREGIGVTPELLDELRISGKNPVWYLRVSWLEKIYGRRGRPQRREQTSADAFTPEPEEGSDVSSRPDLVHVLRERIKGLEQDKQDLRDEMKIKNQQMADRVEREKETNALIRDLHTLMADLQRRLPPPTQAPSPQIMDGRTDEPRPVQRAEEAVVTKSKSNPSPTTPEKGNRAPTDRRHKRNQSRQKPAINKPAIAKKPPQKNDAPPTPKSKSLWSRLFPR
jgi:hypothetical protein